MKKTVEGSSLQSKHRQEKDEIYLPHHSHIHSSKLHFHSTVFEWMSRQLIQTPNPSMSGLKEALLNHFS